MQTVTIKQLVQNGIVIAI